MALDILSGFGETFSKVVAVALGSVLPVSAYSSPAFGQNQGAPAMIVASHIDCQTRLAYKSIAPDGIGYIRLQPAAGPAFGSKSAAIVGRTRSKLEEMRDAQTVANQSPENGLSLSTTGFTVMQVPRPTDCAAAPAFDNIMPPEATIAPTGDLILGSLSLAIKHSPFDRDWAAVSTKQVSRKTYRTLAATGARKSGNESAQVEAVNRWVNRNIAFGEDRDVYGRADYWAPAAETLHRRIGDCEDFAIAKMELLSALGISRDKMRLVVARDLVRNADHAVLVVTMAGGAVMLDNMTDRLLDARLPNDYRPIMSFSQNAKWVHGYAAQNAQPVRMELASPVPQPAASRLADVQTVTAQPEMPTLSMALLSVPLALPSGLSEPV